MASTSADRKRKQRQRDRDDPNRQLKKLNSIFMFGEVEVSVFVDDDVWFKAVDLARALEMENPNSNVCDYIDKKYCKSYEELTFTNGVYCDPPNIQPKTTFVNETGMNMYVLRSRKPKAEAFAEWVCGVVLPSIRKTNRYEIEPSENPYRELNEFLKNQIDELKKENENFQNEIKEFKNEIKEFKNENKGLKEENKELQNKNVDDIKKYANLIFEMKPSCVQKLKNEVKNEYFVLYRKYNEIPPDNDPMLYYACRIQFESLEHRRVELLDKYPDLEKLLQFLVPNSVNFYNLVLEKMSDFIERRKGQSFDIKGIDEEQLVLMIDNLHRSMHGGMRDSNTFIKVYKNINN